MWDLIVSVPDHCLSFYFDNISENKVTLTKVVSPELKFSRRNRKCAEWMDISGCQMD